MSYGVSQSEGRRSRAVWRFTSGHFCTFHQMAAGMWVVQITCCKAFLSWEVHAQCQFVMFPLIFLGCLKKQMQSLLRCLYWGGDVWCPRPFSLKLTISFLVLLNLSISLFSVHHSARCLSAPASAGCDGLDSYNTGAVAHFPSYAFCKESITSQFNQAVCFGTDLLNYTFVDVRYHC